jgi:hypothetical protein
MLVSSYGWAALAASLFLIVPGRAEAGATITARTASFLDVSSAVALAHDGDTVVIPAGTATWTTTLNISKGITLMGATTVDTSTTFGDANDQTIILDNVPRAAPTFGRVILAINISSGALRISGITFRDGSLGTGASSGTVVPGTYPPATARVDHCHFYGPRNFDIITQNQMYGVIDHCIFEPVNGGGAIYVQHGNWGGSSNNYGDGSWTDPPFWGSEKFVFIEDNCFNNIFNNLYDPTSTRTFAQTVGNIDCINGGRYVCRHNKFNGTIPNTHGTETRGRSSRAIEIYNNTLNMPSGTSATGGQLRGGTMLIHDNTYTGSFGSGMTLRCYREFSTDNAFWGECDGTNPWDLNDPSGVVARGTHTGASGSTTLTDSTKNWTSNQWLGYFIRKVNTTYMGSYITGNTSNAITHALTGGNGANFTFNTGDAYEVRKITAALDQPGRGQGDLLSGDGPNQVNTATGTKAWPHQALEPIYSWNNTVNGKNLDISNPAEPTIQGNRDYYNQTAMTGYTPYVYPHPLVSGASTSTAPAPPQNLRTVP